MKRLSAFLLTLAAIVSMSAATLTKAHAASPELPLFTGTTKLACEAILCLSSSSGGSVSACSPALAYFYGINERYLSDTLDARLNFLRQCPTANETAGMSSLVDALAHGAGRCDAATLNRILQTWRPNSKNEYDVMISNQRPSYCSAYAQHAYTDLADTTPRYVGKPEEWGYWVEPQNYEAEIRKYEIEVKRRREQEAQQAQSSW